MGVEVKKQDRETVQGMVRRFTKKMQKSGILVRARKGRYHQRAKSHTMKKRAALRREQLSKEFQRTKKLGIIKK